MSEFIAGLFRLEITPLALLACAAWVYLVRGRAGFWQADQWLEPVAEPPARWPSVAAIIPARDEAETVGRTVASLLAQDYPGSLTVTVVDDGSTDGTADAARAAAATQNGTDPRLTVIEGKPLPRGWTGKLWALSQGIDAATADRSALPDYLLLTDADIAYRPGALAKIAGRAAADKMQFVSLMARLDARGPWGRLLIPAFIYFFQLIYPFRRANDPLDALSAAAGGCFLIRRAGLENTGGIATVRDAIIDDCALAWRLKHTEVGLRTLTALTHDVHSLRDNRSLGSIWNMVARTAFTQLGCSYLALAGALAGLALTFVVPVWAVAAWLLCEAPGYAALLGLLAWAAMARTYWPTLRLYGIAWPWAFSLPAATVLYGAMTLTSALRHLRGTGARWKGRSYPAA
mgnify:CR=1 FL=1